MVKSVKSVAWDVVTMMLTREEAKEVLTKLSFKRRLSGMDLIVAIARSRETGKILMQAYMNKEAVVATLTTGKVTYWSTSRKELWAKGETSGCPQVLRGFSIDCDGDSIVLDVEQTGPACHKGLDSCFDTYRQIDEDGLRDELIGVIKEEALTFGDFTLTSGKKSSYYLDIKKITTYPDRLTLISQLIASRFKVDVDVVAGPELGAIPIVVSVALELNLPYVMIRKGKRSHGMARSVEGRLGEGDRVLLIDDITTTGGSLIRSVEAVRETGAEVARVTCVVDRKEGAAEALGSMGVEFLPLLTIRDLGLRS